MNRIYRLVWNRTAGHWVAVSEETRSVATGSARLRSAAVLGGVYLLTTLAASLGIAGLARAAPVGPRVTSGTGSVSQTGSTTNVAQSSANLSLNWQSFNVAPNEVVNFVQPGASSIAVNRILSSTGSEILGHVNANGQVWLINPNGILFGPGAQVNVGGLTASTLDVDDATPGSATRKFSGTGTGSIVNRGAITAADGGYVALVGNQVSNQGVISARLGTVALGAGSAATLTFSGRQLIHLQVDQSTLDNLAENRQLIQADGGRVIMTAGAQDALLASVVNNTGVVQARTVENHNGTITLLAGMQAGRVDVGGTLDASAPSGGSGGSIETSGAFIALASGAKILAGPGGSWLIDPTDLTIDTTAATAIANALDGGTSVTEQTTATSATGYGVQAPGLGDINVNAAVTWTNPAATLTLSAYNAIYVNAPVNGAGAVVMQATNGNLTVASGASITGTAGVTLGTGGAFINNAGAGALAGGRWLVYSTNPTLDSTVGIAPDFIQYAAAFQATPAQATGNGFLYSVAPSLSVDALSGTASKVYDGGTAAALTGPNYSVSGLLNGDIVAAMAGTYGSAHAGTAIAVTSAATIAGLTITGSGGTIPVYGYALSGSPVTASIGTITPASLSAAIVGDPTKVYDGTATATLSSGNYGLTGFVSGESATVNQPSSVAYGSASAGTQTVTASFARTNFVAASGTDLSNYVLPASATGSGTVQQAPLRITGVVATDKVYDATSNDTLDLTQAGLYGIIGSDVVALSTSGAAGSFASPNAGSRIAVGTAGFGLSGAQQADYQLIQPTGLTASITRAPLTVSGILTSSKVYDGNATAALSSSGAALSGIVGGDAATVVLSSSAAAGTFSSANVGTALPVTTTGYSISGVNATNYSFAQPLGLVANITPALLTVGVVGNPTKPYNGTTTAALTSSNFSLTGFVSGEGATIPQTSLAAYATVNAGVQTVTATLAKPDFSPTGATLMSNYTLPTSVTGSGTINQAPLTGMITDNPTKVYDSTTGATLTGGNYVLYGFLSGEGATVNQTSGAYASANVGVQSVTAGLSAANYSANAGTLLANYVLPTTLAGTGTITPAVITGSVYAAIQNDPTKAYDGTRTATLGTGNYVLTGFIAGQGATVTQTVGQYASANAGTQTVTASLTTPDFTANAGTTLSNYTLPGIAYGTGTITPVALGVAIVNDPTRVYNGSTSMVLASSNYAISGFVGSEGATINPSALINYASANAGAQNIAASLTPSAYTADSGTLMSNYVLATSAAGAGHITPASLHVTGVAATTKVYDTTTSDPLDSGSAALAGLVGSDVGNVSLLGTATGSFATIHVGTALPVTVSGYSIGGSAGSNYTLQPVPTLTAGITAAPLTIAGVSANAKPYDGTDTATLNTASQSLTGILGSDAVTLSASGALASFASINVGNNLKVNASGFVLGGAQAGDYALNQPSGLSANITQAPITALIVGNPTKVYDGSSSTTLTAANYTAVGLASGESVSIPQSATANYAAPDAGTSVGVSSTLVSSDFVAGAGTNLSNYLLPTTGSGTGTITQAVLVATIVGNPAKVYDGTTAATLTSGNYTLGGFVGSQSAAVNQASGTYGSLNAGRQSVTASLASGDFSAGSSTNLSNYLLPVAATGSGTITPAALTVAGATTTARVYDGTTVDALTGATLTGSFYNGDNPVLTNATTGNLGNSGNVGTDAVTTSFGLSGAGSGNYALAQPGGLTAVISPATLSATSSLSRTYDATNVASLGGANTTITGFVSGQGATVNASVTGTFTTPDVGSGLTVTGGALVAGNLTVTGGTLLSNYILPTTDNGTGTINAATLTYTAATSSQVYGLTPTGLTGAVSGFVGGDTLAGATTGTAVYTTLATSASNVGRYAIAGSGLVADNGDYVFIQAAPNATALTITPASLTVAGVTTTPRVYNGTTVDALTGATLTGTFYNGDLPVLTNTATGVLGNSGNVGTDTVTTSFGLSGTGSGNYTVAQATGLTAVISAMALTATSSVTRAYNGGDVASLSGGNTVITGFLAGQGATVKSGVTGTFASTNAGSGIVVTGGALVAGNLTPTNGATLLSNYTLPTSDNGTGTITKAFITLNGTRAYDGFADADSSIFAMSGLVTGQTLGLTGSGTLNSKNVASNALLASRGTLTLVDGTGLASNYTLVGGTDRASVTKLDITVAGTGTSRVYDGTLNDAITLASAGKVSGDSLNFADTSAVFADKNVGSGKTVTISGITASGTDAGNYTLINATTTTTASITPLSITVTGTGIDKVYDGGLTDTVTLASAGKLIADSLSFSGAAVFGDKNVANGKPVSISGISASGADIGNYTLVNTTATTTASITPLAITVTGTGTGKVYDGNVTDAVSLTSTGVLSVDSLSFADSLASFATKGVGTGKTVSISGITASGPGFGNYSFNTTATATASITPLAISVTGNGLDKVYDGGVNDAVTLASAGKLGGDSLNFADTSAVFGDKNVAGGKTVTISGITASGADLANYTLVNTTTTTTAGITPLAITVTGVGTDKVYDGGLADIVTLASAGKLIGDSLNFTGVAVFGDKNVANNKTVSIAGISASGTDVGNYTLSNTTATTTASITPLAITVTGTGTSKVYDGNVTDAVTLAGTGVLSGDSLTYANTLAVFGDKNVANGKTVSISGITASGAGFGNYTFNTTATTTADITPLAITVTGTGVDKVYDGGLNDVVTLASAGKLTGDIVSFANTAAVFGDKNVASGKTVSISGITASGTDAGNYSISNATATTTATITPLAITVTGTGIDKVYDGGLAGTVILASAGKVIGDSLAFADTSAVFGDKNVATGKTVSISGISASGTDAGNYTLGNTTATTTASIAPLAITVTGTGIDKVYDGGIGALVTLASAGKIVGDSLSFADSSAVFADRNVANGKAVSISGITASGTDVGNYSLNNATATTTASITPLAITVTGTGTNKVYDGNLADTATLAGTGVLSGDSLTFANTLATFADKGIGTGKTVSISGITASGTGAGNYTVNTTATTTANITPLAITVTGTGIDKVYDGGIVDAVTLASAGVVTGDSVTFGNGSALFADKNVGTGKTVSISGITAGGTDAANYVLNNTAATTAASITPLAITVIGTGTNKIYDGGVADTVTLASGGILGEDSLRFSSTSAAFADKNAANGKVVSIAGITASGVDAGNYAINATATTSANITPLAITVAGTGTNRVYDGSTADAVTLASAGVLAGDSLSFGHASATFGDKNVGNGKTVTIGGITAGGTDAVNYTLTNVATTTTASITPLGITVAGMGTSKVYDGNVVDTVALSSAGVVAGDSLSFANTSAAFADKNVANGKTVTISGITAHGADAANYTLSNVAATTTANITPLAITVDGTGTSKVYDGGVGDIVTLASTGLIAGDSVSFGRASASFSDKNAGNAKSVTISGITASGADAGNYVVNGSSTTTASITPLGITVSGTGTDKVYDGSVGDAVTLASAGVLSGDSVSFGHASAAFGDRNVGNGKAVTITGIVATGTDAANYSLNNVAAATAANITPATLTQTASPITVASGQVPILTGTVTGLVPGDTLANSTTGNLVWVTDAPLNPSAGSYAIDGSGLHAANYSLAQAAGNGDALRVTSLQATPAGIPPDVFSLMGFPIAMEAVATPFGVGTSDDYGNNTGNARRDSDKQSGNQHLTDFTGRLAVTVITGGVRLPPGVAP